MALAKECLGRSAAQSIGAAGDEDQRHQADFRWDLAAGFFVAATLGWLPPIGISISF
ncbi:hypothetical protein [Bradyrhizobium frederickii]|uniref:hypothetical protein n=1 Tax=Bradyrhizobium frederickii TaxID=2560054 RepID=UPI001ADDAD4D|nr:hypothetical protein [Bradyrhizobium frederickii]